MKWRERKKEKVKPTPPRDHQFIPTGDDKDEHSSRLQADETPSTARLPAAEGL